ncbi:MAG: tetratricopeptide repeat protein [Desulfofustis sp.]|jgi:tol-pal system protein YbgF
MKKPSRSLLCALIIAPFLMQCASQDDLNLIHAQLRNIDKKLTNLESVTVEELRKRQASNTAQIDQIDQELMALRGGLEETGHLNRRLKEQSKELETAFQRYTKQEEEKRLMEMQRLEQEIAEKDQQLNQFSEQLKTQQENLQAIQQARVDEAKRKAAAAAKAAEAARKKADAANSAVSGSSLTRIRADKRKKLISSGSAAASAPQPTATPATAVATPAQPAESPAAAQSGGDNLARGKNLFSQGKFREAYQQFENVAMTGSGAETIEAKYMMGEALFALQEYDQAILDYQAIITNHPSSAKAPAAMLKQAMAFEKLNDTDTAKILYKKLVATYKDSPEAQQAQQKIN